MDNLIVTIVDNITVMNIENYLDIRNAFKG